MKWARRAVFAAIAAVAVLVSLAFAVPLPARLADAGSAVVEYRDGSTAAVFLAPDGRWRIPVAAGEVAPAYVRALVRLEDRRFWHHPGVDPIAVLRSAWLDLRRGRAACGASTLTMQLVRLLEPRPRTLGSKAVEAFRAMQLELRVGKRRILDAYLAHVPFGRNVEGVEAASLAYFGHGARALTAAEIATLLAVPQDPERRYPSVAHRAALAAARDRIARRLLDEGVLPLGPAGARLAPAEALDQVKAAPLPAALRPFPRGAIHAAVWLHGRAPGLERLRTTLDRGAQETAERIVRAAAPALALDGIHNGAAVVVDHGSGEVRALVGNFDFHDEEHGGQIAGFLQRRSAGSTLKPFLYAAAVGRGIVLPDELVEDVPTRFGDFSPRNYDRHFAGLVRFEEALSESLNVPFVRLLSRFGVRDFIGLLGRLGVHGLLADPDRYGLSAVVGGVEISPLDLAHAYTALAEDGRLRPLRLLARGVAGDAARVLAPGAVYLTRRALSRRDRPDFPERRQMSGAAASIHWKTGTSFGHRDAWAVGSGPRDTVAVWLGNFDGTPSADLVGAEAAGPIFFDLLEALDGSLPPRVETPPPDLTEIDVCAVSGYPPGPACPERRRTLALREHVPTRICPYHVSVDVDLDSGLALAPGCRAGRPNEKRTFLAWPASVRRWLSDEQRRFAQVPALAPGCQPAGGGQPPAILSPPPRQVTLLVPGVPAARQAVALEAESPSAAAELSWFVDGEWLGTFPPDRRVFWTPSLGEHEIVVTDEAGRAAHRRVSVRGAP